MAFEPRRLRRLIRDQVGECYDDDLEARVAALETLASGTAEPRPDDLAAMGTLGDDTRHRLVRLLAASETERCVCELTPLVDVSESAVSHALSDLVAAGLVTRRKDGSWRYYETTDRAVALLEALDRTREVVV
jgi:DNA-binding transcriptional ArsR family regulator